MTTLVTANLILWLSIFTYFMPSATSQAIDSQDNIVSIHKIDNQ